MSFDFALLGKLALHFLLLSPFAIGGANAVVPEMHRQAVEIAGWMTDRQFADLFAIAQVAPGPNIIIVTLIGYHVAGIPGALVATFAMIGPSCVLVYFANRTWNSFQHAKWRMIVQSAMVPISVGLIAASALIVAQAAVASGMGLVLAGATAGIAYFTRIHPLWMFALAGILGYAGLV